MDLGLVEVGAREAGVVWRFAVEHLDGLVGHLEHVAQARPRAHEQSSVGLLDQDAGADALLSGGTRLVVRPGQDLLGVRELPALDVSAAEREQDVGPVTAGVEKRRAPEQAARGGRVPAGERAPARDREPLGARPASALSSTRLELGAVAERLLQVVADGLVDVAPQRRARLLANASWTRLRTALAHTA